MLTRFTFIGYFVCAVYLDVLVDHVSRQIKLGSLAECYQYARGQDGGRPKKVSVEQKDHHLPRVMM